MGMISQSVAERVLNAAGETGGDFAELYMENGCSSRVSMRGGVVENAAYSESCGAGVRVLKGTRQVYAYTAETSEEALIATARAAAAALDGVGEGREIAFAATAYGATAQIPTGSVKNDRRIALLRDGTNAAKAVSSEIVQVSAQIQDSHKDVFICNSNGVWATDKRPSARYYISVAASDGTEMQTGGEGPGRGMGFETFDQFDVAAISEAAARRAVTMLHAPECPAGAVPVVIDGGFGGVIFHEACGHSLEATAVSKGNSEFCGMLGKPIAAPCVTAIDDGTIPGAGGSIGCDDEGTPSARRVLIENGILCSYMVDLLGSRRMGLPVTGNSRRQDYSFAPTSRMTNTYIAAGSDDEEAMIRTMGDGLFAKAMGGGSVNPLTGEFNFSVSEGYWVKNGEILTPVRGATLVGKGSEILMKIDRVGREMWMAQGVCGSMSGSVRTNVGQPRIRVSQLTVGGQGGAL